MDLTQDQQRACLAAARAALEAKVKNRPLPKPLDCPPFDQKLGCFVTLTNGEMLRGCIGTFQPGQQLGKTLVEMTCAAAEDPRFLGNPITPEELKQITIAVSILSPLTETDDPMNLEIGTHGIYITSGFQSGCFLPEVASDQGWDAEDFLDFCCTHKAHLPPGAWRNPDTNVYLFTTEKFSE